MLLITNPFCRKTSVCDVLKEQLKRYKRNLKIKQFFSTDCSQLKKKILMNLLKALPKFYLV